MDELYVVARRVLLDALDALGDHRGSVVLVGAQAIYLRVGEAAGLAVEPYTTDGDLAIDPSVLAEVPPLEQALGNAGFVAKDVGIWCTQKPTRARTMIEVSIDLLVPRAVSPGQGRRAARLTGHDERSARIVEGLEGALVDEDAIPVPSLEADVDGRVHHVRVAGPAALLVAKLHKIRDRAGKQRQSDKDALDVLRLLRGTDTNNLAGRMRAVRSQATSAAVAENAVELLRTYFGSRNAPGTQMVVRATANMADPQEIEASCEALAADLLAIL